MQDVAYFDDTYRADLETTVLQVGERAGARWVAVRECLFHPQGGGQPADRGWIDGHEIVPVRDPESGMIVAFAAPGADPLAVVAGQTVHSRIDLATRISHAALHTAGHLIEAAGRAQGWQLAGNNHFPGQARIEFTAPQDDPRLSEAEGRDQVTEQVRCAVRDAIAADLPVRAVQQDDGLRVVHLGDLHAAPCGGTHVTRLADLADVDLDTVKVKKGRIKVGYRATHRPDPSQAEKVIIGDHGVTSTVS